MTPPPRPRQSAWDHVLGFVLLLAICGSPLWFVLLMGNEDPRPQDLERYERCVAADIADTTRSYLCTLPDY